MSDRAQRRDLAVGALAAVVIAFGAWLRVQSLEIPPGLAWDEHHFVLNAQNYLAGRADWNDHPPLGKLFMVVGIRIFGDNSFGWRVPCLVAGWASIALAAWLARGCFGGRRAPLLAAAFLAGDGFFIAYSRTALLDGMLATFALAVAVVTVHARKAWHVALGALLLGFGCSVKLSLLPFVFPLVLVCVLPRRAPRWSLGLIALAPLAYGGVWSYGLAVTHRPYGVIDVVRATTDMVAHHAALSEWRHPWLSHWYTWLVPNKPLTMRFEQTGDVVRAMSSMGNTFLWWAASASVLLALLVAVVAAAATLRDLARGRPDPWVFVRRLDRGELWCLGFWLLWIVPWVLSDRDSYIYHYLAAYGFGVVLVAGKAAQLIERRPKLGVSATVAILVLSCWMAPVWGELPISANGYVTRLWFPAWRHKLNPSPGA